MNIAFEPSTLEDNRHFFDDYRSSLSAVFDNYLEDRILDSRFYHIAIGSTHAGYCAVFDGNLLTQFHLDDAFWRHAQEVFRAMLCALCPQWAYVPTGDAAMLSVCLDFQSRVELQAYCFQYGSTPVRPPEYPRSALRLTHPGEWEGIEARTGGFFDMAYYNAKKGPDFRYEIHELSHGGQVLGYGLRESGRIFTHCHATGMYTLPEHRRKNVGRSVILHLKDICEEEGFHALPGCWYHNHGSKHTLESAGYVTKARLLKVHLQDPRNDGTPT